jgi:hypothetical protein
MMGHAPDHFRRYNEATTFRCGSTTLGLRHTEIVRLAVSQTTRCPVCMAGREGGADDGLTEELIASLCTADRHGFTDAEVALLDFTLKFATDHRPSPMPTVRARALHPDPDRGDRPARGHMPRRTVLADAGLETHVTLDVAVDATGSASSRPRPRDPLHWLACAADHRGVFLFLRVASRATCPTISTT